MMAPREAMQSRSRVDQRETIYHHVRKHLRAEISITRDWIFAGEEGAREGGGTA